MNHDHGLMIHYEKYNQQVYIQICKFILITDSRELYMFWPPIVTILRVVLTLNPLNYLLTYLLH